MAGIIATLGIMTTGLGSSNQVQALCTGNPHDADAPTGNPHDANEPTGNPHDQSSGGHHHEGPDC